MSSRISSWETSLGHLSFTLQHICLLSLPQPSQQSPCELQGCLVWFTNLCLCNSTASSHTRGHKTYLRGTPKNLFPLPAFRASLLQTSNILLSDLTGNWEEAQRILVKQKWGFLMRSNSRNLVLSQIFSYDEVKEHLLLALKRVKMAHEDLQVQRYLRKPKIETEYSYWKCHNRITSPAKVGSFQCKDVSQSSWEISVRIGV